ncbi:ABC transporter substrate-binding protein [Streptomyces albireticuli]|uniref:ABC transporter substrate-binding protein n=1 Tax=Streptomyces albireticuli TaxID=1940 RepID=A0A2A2D1S4_9ACTN|nr:ABC transporter substrate-binding protein [Streptomyces albireticuli]MCD9143419.1 ABC transporter substrate-binding protein [Streptomyces albireticuli]MCD9164778.1 ABC transporter substrate-binding protein [Streptomyces albireticuli]MCD9191536.1 ABC transporter substrate-binding protein [Streptomyces albireticuli]PAU45474.1 ABC transporter substrate-binding protein [Streptomyces albireticuli]
MRKRDQWLAAPLGAGLAAALLTGCGSEDGNAGGTGESVVMGMSDEVVATDPASGYDPGSWLLFNNVFQSLMSFPKGGITPQPDAAENCKFQDEVSQTYQCKLKDGLKFSNGHDLTSEDVAHSFRRTIKINDKKGPASSLLSSIKDIKTPDKLTVVFHLNRSDATFPQKIASGAGSIVDHEEYPADKLRTDGKAVGSGVYKLDSFDKKEAKFSVNTSYKGAAAAVNNRGVTMKFFHGDQAELKSAVQKGSIDLAYRGLPMKDIADLEAAGGKQHLKVIEGTSAEVQHLVFNTKDPVVGKLGVRKAIAYLVDRSALVRDVYKRTAEPLYSIVPSGVTGHKTPFFEAYGDRPQPDKAAAALNSAGIKDKVKLTLWATPVRYGPGTVPEFQEIAKQLNKSGLFEADVKSVPLEEYEAGVAAGKYGVYVKGWVPDYPDPDNFTAPFFGEGNVLLNNYESKDITNRILATAAEGSRPATVGDFTKVQTTVAQELPILPLWQGKQYAVASDRISGLQWTLDASTVFRFWEIGKAAKE